MKAALFVIIILVASVSGCVRSDLAEPVNNSDDQADIPQSLNCEDYRYSSCPEGCAKRCVPSVCSGELCTADCDGEGSCTFPGA